MEEGKVAKTYDNSKTNEEGVYINNFLEGRGYNVVNKWIIIRRKIWKKTE